MTYRNGRRALVHLIMKADRLDRLQYRKRNKDDEEVKGVVDDILLSPLLKEALKKPISRQLLSGSTILVGLDRSEIGDDDAKIVVNILISQFKGQVIIPDFGFYADVLAHRGEGRPHAGWRCGAYLLRARVSLTEDANHCLRKAPR